MKLIYRLEGILRNMNIKLLINDGSQKIGFTKLSSKYLKELNKRLGVKVVYSIPEFSSHVARIVTLKK
ncbi:hypothetical protein JNUCC31_17960 [Paenibacillus sp. JNUCC31]|uniref:hypothetical protein n=1 Tax=Paenibacillus sp. JNUCC-31 TaxID=2777983 RepID=UPI0017868527|nr:hypothetical protein [Paenibacillus sp. JNUCC-31]QOS76726.1 hypothetical protein JNUCC31_17960 [Paenibacillus sp. JNUCC-31]